MASAVVRQVLKKQVAQVDASAPHFYFFKSPTVIMPSFILARRIFNPIHRRIYKRVEPVFSYDKLMNGAIQATILAAIHLRERRLDRFRDISTESMTNYIRVRLPELPQEQLDRKLDFGRHHIVSGFTHASLFSMHNIFHATFSDDRDSLIFHNTVALFIDKNGKFARGGKKAGRSNSLFMWRKGKANEADEEEEEECALVERRGDEWLKPLPTARGSTIRKLLASPEDLLVCNITLSRNVGTKNPENYGRWRITDLNFFDCEFAFDKHHNY